MAFENGHAFTGSDVPEPAGFIDGGGSADVASELELGAGNLATMTLENVDGLADSCIPDLERHKVKIFTIAVPSKEPVRILSPSALKFKETIYP